MPKMGAVKRLTLRISNGRHLRYLTGITIEFQITLRKYVRSNRSLAGKRHARLALWPQPSGIGAGDRQLNGPCRGPRGDPKIGTVACLPNTSTPARASRPGAGAAHGPDAAADVKRFDEQLVQVEGARASPGASTTTITYPCQGQIKLGRRRALVPTGGRIIPTAPRQ